MLLLISFTMKYFLFGLIVCCLCACSQKESGHVLSKKMIKRLKGMQLLDEGETVLQFYTNYKKKITGNFVTDRRVAAYWIDARNKANDVISFAYYGNISQLAPYYKSVHTTMPYLLVTTKDRKLFKVYVDGNEKTVKTFFDTAIAQWEKHKPSLDNKLN